MEIFIGINKKKVAKIKYTKIHANNNNKLRFLKYINFLLLINKFSNFK